MLVSYASCMEGIVGSMSDGREVGTSVHQNLDKSPPIISGITSDVDSSLTLKHLKLSMLCFDSTDTKEIHHVLHTHFPNQPRKELILLVTDLIK